MNTVGVCVQAAKMQKATPGRLLLIIGIVCAGKNRPYLLVQISMNEIIKIVAFFSSFCAVLTF